MTAEEIQKKYDHLVERMAVLRGWQKQYAMYRIKDDWIRCRKLEREIDSMIEEEVKKKRSKQKEIF